MSTAPHTIADRLNAVQERIVQACQRAGRRPEEVTLIAVSKTFPLAAVERAIAAGLGDFGENRVQELVEKAGAFPGEVRSGQTRWHMIGHLQRNKAREVIDYADLFHALDSPRLARELNKRAAEAGRVLPCLVQVNVSGEDSKFGLEPDALSAFIDKLSRFEHLRIGGLMTLAAPTNDPEDVRSQFQLLRHLLASNKSAAPNVQMEHLSMGMSGDFEVAIEEGATLIRVGTALFGTRD